MPDGNEFTFKDPALKPENDRPEDGEFLRFSIALCEALYTVDELTKTQVKIILYIVRMTWGWGRKRFLFNQKAAIEKIGCDKSQMSRAYKALVSSDVLMTQKDEVGVNKYIDQWNLELLSKLNDRAKSKKQLQKNQLPEESCKKTNSKTPKSCKKANSELQKSQLEQPQNADDERITATPIDTLIDKVFILSRQSLPVAKKPTDKDEKKNGWAAWVDANTEAGRATPLAIPKDTKLAKTVYEAAGKSYQETKAIFAAYLQDKDRFVVDGGYSLGVMMTRISKYQNTAANGKGQSDYTASLEECVRMWAFALSQGEDAPEEEEIYEAIMARYKRGDLNDADLFAS